MNYQELRRGDLVRIRADLRELLSPARAGVYALRGGVGIFLAPDSQAPHHSQCRWSEPFKDVIVPAYYLEKLSS